MGVPWQSSSLLLFQQVNTIPNPHMHGKAAGKVLSMDAKHKLKQNQISISKMVAGTHKQTRRWERCWEGHGSEFPLGRRDLFVLYKACCILLSPTVVQDIQSPPHPHPHIMFCAIDHIVQCYTNLCWWFGGTVGLKKNCLIQDHRAGQLTMYLFTKYKLDENFF